MEKLKQFNKKAEEIAFDLNHRNKINFNISKYNTAVENGKKQYDELEKAKKRAAFLKHKILNNFDKYLIQFEDNFLKRGGKIIWAQNNKEAINEILKIAKKNLVSNVVKSKSMTTEEINLNQALKEKNIEVLETDLGEYIVQLAEEKPYHIVTPAMHKSKEDVIKLFHEKFNTSLQITPEEITNFVRGLLREKFQKANIGITGANFLIADIGAIAITENEGNGVLTMSYPKIHIVITSIEKIIPSIEDLNLFWPLLSTYGTGQNITVYNSLVLGPKQSNESDGPEQMYVVLLDNKRSQLYAEKKQYQALCCIRCGACLNACPIYKNIGGYTYNTTYSGPIGSIINPHLLDMFDYKHQSFASTLCGACSEVCPVKIPLHELLLYNRKDSVKRKFFKRQDQLGIKIWKKIILSRKRINFICGSKKNTILKIFFKKSWGIRRELPVIKEKSFNQLWKEKQKKRLK